MAKKEAPARVMAGMRVGKPRPKGTGMGDVKLAEHERVVREREAARKKGRDMMKGRMILERRGKRMA